MQPPSSTARTLGLLLAGGRGQRMGGVDKGLLDWHGRPLAAWVLDALRPQVDAVWISANRNTERYATWGHPVLADTQLDPQGFGGPCAGVQTALQRLARQPERWDWLWLAPCDMPRLPPDLAAALHAARGSAPAILPRTPDGRLQPVHALLSTKLPPPAPGASLLRWLLGHGAVEMDWPTPLSGFNTPEALQAEGE